MNTNDLLLRWSQMSLDQIEDEIRTGKDADSVEQLLGAETALEMESLSFAPPSAGPREAVVLLPGIMGSLLSSIRGVTSLVWINPLVFLEGNARYLRLDPRGQVDACPEVEMVPVGLEKMTYLKMALALNRKVDLYEFPYDWRRPVAYNARVLRSALRRWSSGSNRKFTLVAHSMGGLVSRSFMAQFPAEAEKRVKQLIMLGTPNYGATNAIETLFSGNSLMATVDGINRMNGMTGVVRSFPGVYNLLPAPPEFFPQGRTYPASWNLYDAASWRIAGLQQTYLDSARQLHESLAQSDPQIPMIMIAGCHLETLKALVSDFTVTEMPKLLTDKVSTGVDSGDGTVPLWSALLPGARTYYIRAKHADLPNNGQVINAVLNLLEDGACALPEELPEPRSFLGISFDVPGMEGEVSLPEPPEEAPLPPAELRAKIRSGTASKDDLKSLRFAL